LTRPQPPAKRQGVVTQLYEPQKVARRDRSLPVIGTGGRDRTGKNGSNSEQPNKEVNDETVAYQSWNTRS